MEQDLLPGRYRSGPASVYIRQLLAVLDALVDIGHGSALVRQTPDSSQRGQGVRFPAVVILWARARGALGRLLVVRDRFQGLMFFLQRRYMGQRLALSHCQLLPPVGGREPRADLLAHRARG